MLQKLYSGFPCPVIPSPTKSLPSAVGSCTAFRLMFGVGFP